MYVLAVVGPHPKTAWNTYNEYPCNIITNSMSYALVFKCSEIYFFLWVEVGVIIIPARRLPVFKLVPCATLARRVAENYLPEHCALEGG